MYVQGLLMPGDRKSIEPMAARLGVALVGEPTLLAMVAGIVARLEARGPHVDDAQRLPRPVCIRIDQSKYV